jgi:hypothetical protein
MRIIEYIVSFLTVGALLAAVSPPAITAQPAVAAATSVRVIEFVDPWTGERIRAVAEDLTAPEISRIQRALASAGFDPGRATGRMTPATALALGRFQSSRGLLRCDCVSYETILALRIRPVVVATISAPIDRGGFASEVLVLAPRLKKSFGHGSAVIVGHSPSVFVGHDPALGAGQIHGHDKHDEHDPRPVRPRPRPSISGSGAPLRSLTP